MELAEMAFHSQSSCNVIALELHDLATTVCIFDPGMVAKGAIVTVVEEPSFHKVCPGFNDSAPFLKSCLHLYRRKSSARMPKPRKGGGGGGSQPGRNCDPSERKKLNKRMDVGLPGKELKAFGARLMHQANRKQDRYRPEPTQPKDVQQDTEEDAAPAPSAAEIQAKDISAMAQIALRAAKNQAQYNAPTAMLSSGKGDDGEDASLNAQKEQSLRKFYAEFKKVVDISDVLLEVLDVRDPMGCRLRNVERTVESQWGDRKVVVIVLNKIDMVPQQVVDAWVTYFQNEQKIVLPFTATSEGAAQGNKRARSGKKNACITALYRILRSIGRGEASGVVGNGARKSLTVGVIGYPNVGKSSVINALRRKTVVGVGNTPGFTTGNQEVDLRKDIKILDCPGIVMPGEDTGDVVLRNAVKVDQLANPMAAVARLFERCDPGLLSAVYSIDVHANGGMKQVEDFVHRVGLRRGRLRKGGVVDEAQTAKMILQDWNDGRIGYFTLPPSGGLQSGAIASTSELANNVDDDGRLVLSSFSQTLTADGLPTFHLTPVGSIGGRKHQRMTEDTRSSGASRRLERGRRSRRDDSDSGLEDELSDNDEEDVDDDESFDDEDPQGDFVMQMAAFHQQ